MCEIVERETERLAIMAVRKSLLKPEITEGIVFGKSWEDRINMLASKNSYSRNCNPLVSSDLKKDLASFKTARNLVDHSVRGRREDAVRERQFAERMTQGPRLVAVQVALRRRVQRGNN